MEERKISFEVAKLANLKGFDPKVKLKKNTHYNSNTEELDPLGGPCGAVCVNHYYASTQSLLQKWLRDVHNINVYCIPVLDNEKIWHHNIASSFNVKTGKYEDALEDGLKEALNMI